MIEIERKFLVVKEGWRDSPSTLIRQGYLSREPARSVRIRIAGSAAYLTIKGITQGISRPEFEYPIPLSDAETLLSLCEWPLIEKRRYRVIHEGSCWEVDEFLGDNTGLILAEIELESEDEAFAKPDWLGREVTQDRRYYNSSLALHPFSEHWSPSCAEEASKA